MKAVSRAFCAAMCALVLLCAAALTAPAAHAEPAYQDGDYTVELSFTGGTGRIVWNSPVHITVKDGVPYADFVLSKPNGGTPSVEWMEYNGVRYTAQRDTAAETCSFYQIPLAALGEVPVSANTTAMSGEYVIDYTLHIDDSAIPVVSDTPAQQEPQPTQPEQPVSQPEQPASQPEDQPAEAPDGGKDAAQPADGEGVVTATGVPEEDVPKDAEDTVATTGVLSGAPGAEDDSGLPALGIVGIAAGAVVIIGGGAYLIARAGKGKRDEK